MTLKEGESSYDAHELQQSVMTNLKDAIMAHTPWHNQQVSNETEDPLNKREKSFLVLEI